jgi:ubiquitin-like protein Pup
MAFEVKSMARFIDRLDRHSTDGPGDSGSIWMAAAGEQKKKSKGDGGDSSETSDEGTQKMAKKGEELKEDMDSLMEEIDSVLEENAEEFVKNYVQRGGQ